VHCYTFRSWPEIAKEKQTEIASAEQMKVAVLEVIEKGASKKGVAEKYGIKRTTLRRYIAKYKSSTESTKSSVMFLPKYNARQIFTKEQEVMLADYFVETAKHNYCHRDFRLGVGGFVTAGLTQM